MLVRTEEVGDCAEESDEGVEVCFLEGAWFGGFGGGVVGGGGIAAGHGGGGGGGGV